MDNSELIPMYFSIDEVDISTTVQQGLPTHGVRDVSVYADGFSIGVYSLPVDVPVLESDETLNLDLLAVVRNNGIASNPIEYPFFEPISYEYDFGAGETEELDLTFSYSDQVKVINVGDFEISNALSVDTDGQEELEFVRSSETPYGDFCGKITLSEGDVGFAKSTFARIARETVIGGPIFLEIDYRNEIPFTVGILRYEGANLQVPFLKVGLNPQEEWNKAYIELTAELSDDLIEEFTILIGSSPENTATGSIWIDNMRLVHF